MIDLYKQTITINKLLQDEQKVKITNKSLYYSYRFFLEYFSKLKKITESELVIGINFTYGWMPTMFEFKNFENLDKVVEILNKAWKGADLSLDELELMKSCLNNSIVGSSKLLHFVKPELYPIWDSRVHNYLNEDLKKKAPLYSCQSYIDFLNFSRYISREDGFTPIKSSIEKKVGYEMTAVRTVELIMYLNGKGDKLK